MTYTFSSRARYDHFDTAPQSICDLFTIHYFYRLVKAFPAQSGNEKITALVIQYIILQNYMV